MNPIWETEAPPPWIDSLRRGARWLALAPHPDDELIMCFGFMKQWPNQGHIIIITDGAAGIEGQFADWSPDQIVAKRYHESLTNAAHFGIRPHQLSFIGKQDEGRFRSKTKQRAAYDDRWRTAIEGLVKSVSPDIIIAPHPDELHPDHRAVGAILQSLNWDGLKLYSCYPRGLQLGPATYTLPLSAAAWREKCLAAKHFHSQDYLAGRLTDDFYASDRYWTQEQLSTITPAPQIASVTVHSAEQLLLRPRLRFLVDTEQSKQTRVEAAINAKIALSGSDPWDFASSTAEKARLESTVQMVLEAQPQLVIDCGCCRGGTLALLREKWSGDCVGIESNAVFAMAARSTLGEGVEIIQSDFGVALREFHYIDLLVLTEICYYINPVEWIRLCEAEFSRARSIVFSMRPAYMAVAFLPALLRHFNIEDTKAITRDDEDLEQGWLLVRLNKPAGTC